MTGLQWLGPGLAIVAATLLCAPPWGAAGDLKFVQPLLPYVVIHLTTERRGDAVPDWLVFLAGFTTEVAGQGPLGYWSLIYLSGYTMVRSTTAARPLRAASGAVFFALTLVCLMLMQWSAASIYYLRPVAIMPLIGAAAVAFFVYMVLAMAIPRSAKEPARINDRLQRGI